MKRRFCLLPLLAAAAFAFTACSNPTSPGTSLPISGHWVGSFGGSVLLLNLIDSNGTVTGSGSFAIDTVLVALTVSQGSHVEKDVSLVLSATGYQDMNFSGTLATRTDLDGTLNAPGFSTFPLKLKKQ